MSDKNELVLPMLDNNYSNHEWNVAFAFAIKTNIAFAFTIKTNIALYKISHN